MRINKQPFIYINRKKKIEEENGGGGGGGGEQYIKGGVILTSRWFYPSELSGDGSYTRTAIGVPCRISYTNLTDTGVVYSVDGTPLGTKPIYGFNTSKAIDIVPIYAGYRHSPAANVEYATKLRWAPIANDLLTGVNYLLSYGHGFYVEKESEHVYLFAKNGRVGGVSATAVSTVFQDPDDHDWCYLHFKPNIASTIRTLNSAITGAGLAGDGAIYLCSSSMNKPTILPFVNNWLQINGELWFGEKTDVINLDIG